MGSVKKANIARIEVEDGFVRLITLLKSRLRNLIKQDIPKNYQLSVFFVVVNDGRKRPQVRGW